MSNVYFTSLYIATRQTEEYPMSRNRHMASMTATAAPACRQEIDEAIVHDRGGGNRRLKGVSNVLEDVLPEWQL